VCQTCQFRFRRLHDLKRHTKLHTSERPYTCNKCGRRFARGDALARHSKGLGGCAGRRSSFGGDDAEDMNGVEYGDSDPQRECRQQIGYESAHAEPSTSGDNRLGTPALLGSERLEDDRNQSDQSGSTEWARVDQKGTFQGPDSSPAADTASTPRPTIATNEKPRE
jgi:hypothetical protein